MLRHQRIDSSINLGKFDCANDDMNSYFHKHAKENDRRGISSCHLFFNDLEQLVGYLCWNTASYGKSGLPKKEASGLPGYPIPSLLISRLAVDSTFKGQGFGKEILAFAMDTALELSQSATAPGFRLVVVDAIDAAAITFYKKFGFINFIDPPSRLFLPIATYAKAKSSAV
ncbi:MAG: N-acetyltransferase [Proteobacteria bacterium]|nr:MAG: N-acetyltransferase [Pseudomonadota bacterium]